MYFSKSLIPILKNNPSEAKIKSHKLMLRTGMIKQSSAGIYSWLPLGFKVLNKIEQIIINEQNSIGAQQILMPTIQPADIWVESGRYEDYGQEMLRVKDRSDRDLLYGPTNEELITDIFRTHIKSYKYLPIMLYHIQWKFRDELRPRYGVMRGREFLMKDSYSFDLDIEKARLTYQKVFLSYLRTFAKLGLQAIPVKANPGPIGGDLSHEFVILAPNGESDIFYDKGLLELDPLKNKNYLDAESINDEYNSWAKHYSSTDDMHDLNEFKEKVTGENQGNSRAIEVGHVFYFGTKYSKSMGANIINNTLKAGGRVIPVGTTCLRILESMIIKEKKVIPFSGYTNIFITPGYKFKIASGLITNFHLPKSSLFILVSSFVGLKNAKKIYSHAIKKRYRFFSYGDGSILLK